MAIAIHRACRLARLLDSKRDNPLELTIGFGAPGYVVIHVEDRDAGWTSKTLTLDVNELRAALALSDLPLGYHIED